MKTRAVLCAAVVVIALAGCSPPAPSNSATSTSAAAPSGAPATSIQPGQWRTTITMLEVNSPMLPEAAKQQMLSHPITSEECTTSADVAELTRGSLIDPDEGDSCSENTLNSAGGRVEGHATCTDSEGMTRTMQMSGTYASTHIDMNVTATMQTPQGAMTQRMHMVSDRIGDCAG